MIVTQDTIREFRGWSARLWRFTASHDRLVIELNEDVSRGLRRRYLIISMCSEISVPVGWTVTDPRLEQVDPWNWLLLDERVRIRCQEVSVYDEYLSTF